jgi:4-amino-4-deoxy-L-arabinose transferase-like glycosyltransferase
VSRRGHTAPLPEGAAGKGPLVALAGVTLLAAALRFLWLGREGLWMDESASWLLTRGGLDRLAGYLRADVHPPLYYLALWVWVRLAGASETGMRALSALAGTATVPLLWLLGRDLLGGAAGRRAGVLAALLLAVSPYHVHYSQEAKAYALLLLFVTASAWMLLRACDAPAGRGELAAWAIGHAVLASVAGLVHPAGLFVVPAAVLVVLLPPWPGKKRLWALLSAAAFAPLPFLGWLLASRDAVANVGGALGWARPFFEAQFPWQPVHSWGAFTPVSTPPFRNLLQAQTPWAGLALGLALLVWFVAMLRNPKRAAVPLAYATVPLLALLAVSPFRLVYLVGRTDAPALPFFLAGAAMGIAALPRRFLVSAAVAGIWCAAAVGPLATHYRADYRSDDLIVAGHVAGVAEAGDTVVATGHYLPGMRYYLEGPGRERSGAPEGLAVVAFPAVLEVRPAWGASAAFPIEEVRAEAEALASRLAAERSERGARVVALVRPGAQPDAVLAGALHGWWAGPDEAAVSEPAGTRIHLYAAPPARRAPGAGAPDPDGGPAGPPGAPPDGVRIEEP